MMEPATIAALMNAGGNLLGGLAAARGGPDVIQPYAGSGGISIGGNNAPAGPVPPVPASPFSYVLPGAAGAAQPLQAGMGDLGTLLVLLLAVGLVLTWIKKQKG